MLKTKLVKAGFFGHGAVFLVVSPFSAFSDTTLPGKEANDFINATAIVSSTVIKDSTEKDTSASKAPPIPISAATAHYVKGFISKNKEQLQDVEKRSAQYFSIIEKIFATYEIPLELKYLAVVESNLQTKAKSKVGARGSWQLMAETARDLGLKVNGHVDERTHFYKSTVAAAKYLKALYNELGDWLLVVAAYNSGSGYVRNAIKKSGSRSFWYLQRFLPTETRAHVKHFIGTHYYFQSEGSFAVLTRGETRQYLKKVAALKVEQALEAHADSIIVTR
jgi:membrane-bound lytic murein transglycosylase D